MCLQGKPYGVWCMIVPDAIHGDELIRVKKQVLPSADGP